MIAKLGIVSIYGFLLGLPILFVLIPNTFPIYINYKEINVLYLFIVYAVLTHILVRIINRGIIYNICAQALLLGLTLAAGVMVCILAPTSWKPFGWYVCVMAIFHYSEFLSIAVCNPKTLSPSSFMLNHSVAYGIAAFASWIEYLLWYIFFPNLKTWHSISYIGIVMCTFGEVLRKTAIWTARNNFTHLVQNEKTQTHSLVTNGVYSWFRHPSYVGWFYWSIGTQWIMINPVCIIAYALASWKFFKERIYYEEMTLLNFFGENYVSYQKKVGTGLPFIKGFEIPNEN